MSQHDRTHLTVDEHCILAAAHRLVATWYPRSRRAPWRRPL